MPSQQSFNFLCLAVTSPYPDDVRWKTQQRTKVAEISVFRDNRVPFAFGVIPHLSVQNAAKTEGKDMVGFWKKVGQACR